MSSFLHSYPYCISEFSIDLVILNTLFLNNFSKNCILFDVLQTYIIYNLSFRTSYKYHRLLQSEIVGYFFLKPFIYSVIFAEVQENVSISFIHMK